MPENRKNVANLTMPKLVAHPVTYVKKTKARNKNKFYLRGEGYTQKTWV